MRDAGEVLRIAGRDDYGQVTQVSTAHHGARAVNPAFDVTPARLVTGLVTERGVVDATASALAAAFPGRVRR
jgi:methylthioribose-1-phosphate isomerase